jgi:hypothetical protein
VNARTQQPEKLPSGEIEGKRISCYSAVSLKEKRLQIRRAAFRRLSRHVVVLIGLCLSTAQAQAQKLTIQGDRFAVDGTPRFLTFISFFDAMGAPNIVQDLHLLRSLGFDGLRIWPNLDNGGPQLMNRDGSLRPDGLTRLLFILDQARLERLIVDVTFTYEHIAGMTPATARVGILAATSALRSYDNLLFDIQNERNVQDRRFMSEGDVASIYAGIKAVDPARIATADNSLGEDWGPQYAADFTRRLGLDVTAFHESRRANWYTLAFYQEMIGTLRSNGRPAYLQEPNSTRDPTYQANDRADYYLRAIANAKLAGAAAWCFHTLVAVDFRDGGPPFVEDRLRSYPEPEWAFVSSLKPRIILRANNGINYVVPEGGGGAGVRADRTAAGPGSWEVLGVSALSGGPLVSGDRVALTTADGHYLQATGGGGSSLRATGQSVGAWETFIIERPGGGVIRHGEAVTLRANDTPWYVVAEGGGGGNVNVNSASRGPWETFTLLFVSPHSTDIAPGQVLPLTDPGRPFSGGSDGPISRD